MKDTLSLKLFLDHLRNAAVVAGPRGKILCKNPVFDLLFVRGADDKKPADLFGLLKKNEALVESARKAAAGEGSYFLRDLPIVLVNGIIRPMDVETFPLIDEQGKIMAVALIFHDRSEQSRFEEHQKRLDRIHYLKTIAAGLAHEIKNPLSGIKGASQLLSQSLENRKELREYSEMIRKEVARVDGLLKELLHFTKPRKLSKKKINVNQILHEMVLLQKTIDPERVEFVEEFDPSLPEIRADGEALSQIFLNLIKNARQALNGKGEVTVRTCIVTDVILMKGEKKRQLIGVDIEDNGVGIDEKDLPNIFVPFFTTKPKGTGLGLAVCHQLVEEHEGDIRVKSREGKGTVFSVYLPV